MNLGAPEFLIVLIFLAMVVFVLRLVLRRRRRETTASPPAPASDPRRAQPQAGRSSAPRRRVFISYRRTDTDADAGRLYTDLAAEFGADALFKDVDDVPLGADVKSHIRNAISRSSLVLVLVGPSWDAPRLTQENDWVRMELEAALELGVPIIPVRLRRAELPQPTEVPSSLMRFCGLNAAELEHQSWTRDLEPLLAAIRQSFS